MHVTAHISDLHIHDPRSLRRAEAVVDYLNRAAPRSDAVLVTGDIAEHGLAAEYAQAAGLFADMPAPVLHCPGNHDVRGPYRRGLLGLDEGDAPVNRVHEAGGVRFLLCDSVIPGEDDGELDETTLAWLDATLSAAPTTPAYVCFHHPPVPLGVGFVDGMRLRNGDALVTVLNRHPQVAAVLCGHAHTPAFTVLGRLPVLVAPGVTSTVHLDFHAGGPIDREAPPAVTFHIRHADSRITSHVRFVEVG
ncbi:3',5'-cyclic AMP phosphodiesterase CpdA [Stackebrandtia albiflava]|uniref:3',5'-cyclic AMP phosphodiesterase CpdA n=1 Tax=Stackebrandtia albiflava TaxID=406432 RepID=A0A562VAB7_9ACTN|nr:metallophosphoesterase [Stackebrandtia albiflava]TWJ14829.1 3',5'-cyclic AMP phosphodiesterase CpdA [Stackebrandtia albiflava]